MSDDDRRAHARFDLLAQVTVRNGSVDHVLSILNLSQGGALVDLGSDPRPKWLEMRREVALRVIGDGGSCVLEVEGTVLRISETEDHRTFAVQFRGLVDEPIVRDVLRVAGRPPSLPER